VATLSKTQVCDRLVAVIAGSNTAEGMDVCHFCLHVVSSCVGRGLCDGLITRPEEYYCESVCDQGTSLRRRTKLKIWAVVP
jgi:hypothetical protein